MNFFISYDVIYKNDVHVCIDKHKGSFMIRLFFFIRFINFVYDNFKFVNFDVK
jgi:hypothetical protein